MHGEVVKYLSQSFKISKPVTDPCGHTYVTNTEFSVFGPDLISVNAGGMMFTYNTRNKTDGLAHSMNALEYLNFIRCEAGIGYVTYNALVEPSLGTIHLIEDHSILETQGSKSILKTNHGPGIKINQQLFSITQNHYSFVQLTAESVLSNIRRKDMALLAQPNNTNKNTMGMLSNISSSFGSLLPNNRLTGYTCQNTVIDILGQHYAPFTIFTKKGMHKVEVSVINAMGTRHSKEINLSVNGTGGYPIAEDYIEDIALKDTPQVFGGLTTATTTNVPTLPSSTSIGPLNGASTTNKPLIAEADADYTNYSDGDTTEDPDGTTIEKMDDKPRIKKVYCPYNADLIVYDIHNQRVEELCGFLTPEKFYALISRITDETKFDGFDNFKCAACELGAIKDGPENDNDFVALEEMKERAARYAAHLRWKSGDPRYADPNYMGPPPVKPLPPAKSTTTPKTQPPKNQSDSSVLNGVNLNAVNALDFLHKLNNISGK